MEGYGGGFDILYSTVPIYDADGKDVSPKDPDSAPVPFSVTYTPELFEGMKREISYPSKGGGTVTGENNNISCDISLTKDYTDLINGLDDKYKAVKDGNYSAVICLSKSPAKDSSDLQDFFKNDVVLYSLTKDDYYLGSMTAENVNTDSTASNYEEFYSSLALANGYTVMHTIPKNDKLHVDFDLRSIDYKTHNITSETKLYLNVIGVFTQSMGQNPVDNGETEENENLNGTWLGGHSYQDTFTNLTVSEKIDNWLLNINPDGSLDQQQYYSVYTVSSDSFNFVDYPEYLPKDIVDVDGNVFNPSTSTLDELTHIVPDTVTDVDLKKSGSDGLSKKDYDEYLKEKQWNENFMTDFSPGSISEIFNGTSTFYQFLTASISVLPSWFLTILASFFVIMLAIVVVKFVV